MTRFLLPALLAALVVTTAGAQQLAPGAPAQPGRTYTVAPNLHVAVMEERNSTVLVGEEGLLVVETNYVQRAEALRDLIATISPKPVRLAVNSHWHGDHVGGNALLARSGAVTLAHENTRRRMSMRVVNPQTGNVQQEAWAPEFLPMLTFRDGLKLHFGGQDIELTHYPDGHTDSDVVVRFVNADVIYVGGLLNYPMYAGVRSPDAFIAALDRVLAQSGATTKIIPWRGPLIGKGELQEWRELLATVRNRVATLMREGKTVDEIVAARPTAEFDAKWGGARAPAAFVREIHAALSGTLN